MIKKSINVLGLCALLFFSSCFDTIEEFTINADGTGSYTITMDMYKMMEMMMSMWGDEKMKSDPEYNEVKDSTFYFKDVLKEADELSPEERELFKDARFDMHMAMAEKSMLMKFSFPVSKYGDFNRIYQSSMKATDAMDKQRKKMKESEAKNDDNDAATNSGDAGASRGPTSGKSAKQGPGAGLTPMKDNSFMKSSELYALEVRDGYFSKQVIKEKFLEAMEKDSTIKMMSTMMKDASISTVIHFPRPVKKVDSDKVQLSADKKTVTLKLSMGDYLAHPEFMNLIVQY